MDAKSLNVQYFFVLGYPKNSKVMDMILDEWNRHEDLIVGNFDDTYDNLTLKSLFALNWVMVNCEGQWMLYADDDTLVDIERIVAMVIEIKNNDHESIIYGYLQKASRPIRSQKSKWFMPPRVFSDEF